MTSSAAATAASGGEVETGGVRLIRVCQTGVAAAARRCHPPMPVADAAYRCRLPIEKPGLIYAQNVNAPEAR